MEHRNSFRFLAIFVLYLAFCYAAQAQSDSSKIHKLTLEQSVAMAVDRGLVSRDVTAHYLAARERAEYAQKALWTSVSLSAKAPDYSQQISEQFDPVTGESGFFPITTTNYQGALIVNQPLTLTGATFQLTGSLLGTRQTAAGSPTTNTYFSDMGLSVDQPLLTFNQHKADAERADISLEQAETDFLNAQLDLLYNVTQSFYNVYQQIQHLEIVKTQVGQNQESYNTAHSKFNGGLIPEVEVLQSEVDLATSRNDSLSAERDLAQAKNALRLFLGIPAEEEIEVDARVEYKPLAIDSVKAIGQAMHYRPEAIAAERTIEERDIDLATAKSQRDFRLDFNARYGLNKNDTIFSGVYKSLNDSRSASLTLSLPIFDWGRNNLNVEAAEVDYRDAKEQRDYTMQQIKQETMDLLKQIQVAESRIEVLQRSVEVAQKSYDISKERFASGNITRNDLSLTQDRLTTTKNSYLTAFIDYQLGLADLKRKTHWDFENDVPIKPIIEVKE